MEQKELSPFEKLDLLAKPLWDYNDIRRYFSTGKNKAIEIKKAARIRSNGLPKYDQAKATINAVMEVMGLSLADEISKLKALAGADDFVPIACRA